MHRLISACLLLAVAAAQAGDLPPDTQALRARAAQGDPQAQAELAEHLLASAKTAHELVEVVELAESAAQAKNPEGLSLLAALHLSGRGVAQDSERALSLFRQAAELGHADAWINIGATYFRGLGVSQDYGKALEAYRAAAEAGDARGQAMVGVMYRHGLGVDSDAAKARRWFRRAAEQDDPTGLLNLGLMVVRDDDPTTDTEEGLELIQRAAALGSADAHYTLGTLYANGVRVDTDLERARAAFVKAAAQNQPLAAYRLAQMMLAGEGGGKNPEEAVVQLRKAADLGQVDAMYRLHEVLDQGTGVDADPQQAHLWLTRAARQGHLAARLKLLGEARKEERRRSVPVERVARIRSAAKHGSAAAQLVLGDFYRWGRGVREDREQATRWYRAAAREGVVEAMTALGTLYGDRDASTKNRSRSLKWLRKAAALADAQAWYLLGMALMTGQGGERDEAGGARLLRRAAVQGHAKAAVGYAYALYSGRGVETDVERAAAWLHAPETMDHSAPLSDLASAYEHGIVVPRDRVFAHGLYNLAARLEDGDRSRDELTELTRDLSERELERSRRLSAAWRASREREPPVVAWRARYKQAEQAYWDDDYQQAQQITEEALAMALQAFGKQHANVAQVMTLKARILDKLGEVQAAERHHLRALRMLEREAPVATSPMLSTLRSVARHYRGQQRWNEALEYAQRERALAEKRYGADSKEAADVVGTIGQWLYFADRDADALPYLERAVRIRKIGINDVDKAKIYEDKRHLADALEETGANARAEALYREIIDYYTGLSSARRRASAVPALQSLHLLYWKQDRYAESADALERAIELAKAAGWGGAEQRAPDRELVAKLRAWAKEENAQKDDESARLKYAPDEPLPDSFDLIAKAASNGAYVVDGRSYDFDGMIELIDGTEPAAVLVERSQAARGNQGICPLLIGVATNTDVYVRDGGEPDAIAVDFSRKVIDRLTEQCRSLGTGD